MSKMEKKIAVITGASSGIGRDIAIEMAKNGYDLAVTARREARLAELKNELTEKYETRVLTGTVDIRIKDDVDAFFDQVIKEMGRIDVVVANAGYTMTGAFAELGVTDYKNIFETNFFGTLNTIYPALSSIEKSKGTIVIVGSLLGEFGIMGRSPYSATKFAVRGFYESVRYEFKEKGISLILVEPGFVQTELREMDRKGNRIKKVNEEVKKKQSHSIAVPPAVIAKKIVKVIPKKGFRIKILPFHARVLFFLNKYFPRVLASLVYKNREFVRNKIVK
jgi:short-subunit dehydrogenase